MTRFAHFLVAATYAMSAIVAGAACIRFFGAGPGAAFAGAAFVTLAAAQAHALWAVALGRASLKRAIEDLRDANLLLVEEADAARARLETIEARVEDNGGGVRQDAIIAEMRTLEGLVRTLGARVERDEVQSAPQPAGVTQLAPSDRASLLAAVREALEAGRVDLHLQPIVSLPQRKVRFYEGFTRLRDANGRVIMPTEWLKVAEPAGLVGAIDNLLLFRCIQIVRRLAERERRVGVFCNIAPSSLADDNFFPEFLDFVRRNSDLGGSLVFEISQRAFLRRNHAMARNMARLADFGFRFSIDRVEELDTDVAELQRAGVKFLKAPGSLLIDALKAGKPLGLSAAPDLRAEDYAHLLARHGIELIAEKIEAESTVVEVLELDLRYGQGHLFGSPRPIRDEILDAADADGLQTGLSRRLAS